MDEPKNTAAEEAFWGFSLAFYERPEVAEALITLQDRDGFDVNVILFALWVGLSGRGVLYGDLLTAALRAASALRTEIVQPLRELRQKLRNHPDKDVQQLRKGVKALELAGERLVQRRLAWLAGSANADASPELRQAAARTNLALYLGAEAAPGREAAAIFGALDVFAGILPPRLRPMPTRSAATFAEYGWREDRLTDRACSDSRRSKRSKRTDF